MAESQKIVHIIGTLGQFDASHNLRELARSQAAAGDSVTVIAFSADAEARRMLESARAKCQVIRQRWGYDPFAARQLAQTLRELEPTIVHLWGKRATNAAILVRRALPTAGLVATLAQVPQLKNPWWPNKSLDVLDAIVVDRHAIRAEFVDVGQGEEKVHVIPPGISQRSEETPTRRALLIHLGLPTEARIITIAGPLERWQAVDEAIWCFELVRILHEHTFLAIVGEGPERARLERFTRQVSDAAAVRFVTQAGLLHDVLAHSEIYWQPGASEAIPPAMLAAMAHGLPVVASDVPAHQAVIQAEENGFLVRPTKRAIWARHTDQLMRSADLRNKFASAGKQTTTENFSLTAMTQAYAPLYRDLAATKSELCSPPF
jgi:glycosyltransferase involved in cell wall biosynthesis